MNRRAWFCSTALAPVAGPGAPLRVGRVTPPLPARPPGCSAGLGLLFGLGVLEVAFLFFGTLQPKRFRLFMVLIRGEVARWPVPPRPPGRSVPPGPAGTPGRAAGRGGQVRAARPQPPGLPPEGKLRPRERSGPSAQP